MKQRRHGDYAGPQRSELFEVEQRAAESIGDGIGGRRRFAGRL